MKVYLFGGSNSILKGGLASGLNARNALVNGAIGASGSLQNLESLLQYRAGKDDLIVTESNVNDSYNLNLLGERSYNAVVSNIDAYYFELSRVRCKKVVILMPIRDYLSRTEPRECRDKVRERHLYNINKYGFDFIDIDKKFSELGEDVRFMMPDSRHV